MWIASHGAIQRSSSDDKFELRRSAALLSPGFTPALLSAASAANDPPRCPFANESLSYSKRVTGRVVCGIAPSTFDVPHILAFSIIQVLPFNRVNFLRPLGSRVTSGWQLLNISTLTSGLPFSIYSGIQQTGNGSYGVDRPDQVGKPLLSTSRTVREDYFGQGQANPSFFAIPIGVPGGTGPNQGRLGTLGRDTFRGPAYHDFDFALIKDTTLGHRAGAEAVTLQFRAEFFNAFNLVNFGLPSNVVLGSGFGVINRTAGYSLQLQFSLKLQY